MDDNPRIELVKIDLGIRTCRSLATRLVWTEGRKADHQHACAFEQIPAGKQVFYFLRDDPGDRSHAAPPLAAVVFTARLIAA